MSEGGLDMKLNEQASNLSGGQRQRLALARALMHDRNIYINSYSAHFVLFSLFNYTLNWSRNYTTLKVININQTLAIRLNNLLFDKERFQMA